jgi:hypothetical protein
MMAAMSKRADPGGSVLTLRLRARVVRAGASRSQESRIVIHEFLAHAHEPIPGRRVVHHDLRGPALSAAVAGWLAPCAAAAAGRALFLSVPK